MKHLSHTLIALAVAAPAAFALDVKDDDVKLGLSLQLQVRGEVASADAADGQTHYSVTSGKSVGTTDPFDFYIRRMRLGFKGSYQGDWKFGAIIRIDNQDKSVASTGSTIDAAATGSAAKQDVNFNRRPETHVAYIERVIKQEDLKIEHSIKAGLDYAFFNGASGVFSSSSFLLPSGRATDQSSMLAPRGIGIGYKLDAPYVTWGFDIQNNVSDDAETSTTSQGDGLCYTTRLQLTPEGDLAIKKAVESFLGKPGTGVMVSLEYGKNTNLNTIQDITAYGTEVLVHWNGLSALAEFRKAKFEDNTTDGTSKSATANKNRDRQIWLVQAGYALPLGDAVIEPAVRYTVIDLDKDDVGEGENKDGKTGQSLPTYGSGEYGNSGKQWELGVNYYPKGSHANKIQLGFQNWEAEQGKAKANILRAQWQLSF